MKNIFTKTLAFSIATLSLLACEKDKKEDNIIGYGEVQIEFDHRANGQAFNLGTAYTTEAGEDLTFNTLKYFVSNFQLTKEDGSVYTVPKDHCYFLIEKVTDEENIITLKNIPVGDYTGVNFILGVDSLKSISALSERTGDLDPTGKAAGMYWIWNSGYIFFKTEGTSPSAPLDTASNTNKFRFHIGLFGGYNAPTLNNIKNIELKGHDPIKVSTAITPEVHLKVELMEVFKTPTTISVAATPTVMASPYSANVATNYADMFSLDHVHN